MRAWYADVKKARWATPQDVKNDHGAASFVGKRVVFNIAGNKYRLVALVNYRLHGVFVRFIGTHREYDRIDVETV